MAHSTVTRFEVWACAMTTYSAIFVWSVLYMWDGMPRCFTKIIWLKFWLGRDSRGSGVATERSEGAHGRGESCIHTDTNSNLKAVRKNIPPQHIHAWVLWSSWHIRSRCWASFETLLLSESVMLNTCWAALLHSLLSSQWQFQVDLMIEQHARTLYMSRTRQY